MIEATRQHVLNDRPLRDGQTYVLYWMQQSQRVSHNPALALSIEEANRIDVPVVAVFGLMDDYPEATERQYTFMIEGLADVAAALREIGVKFVVKHATPPDACLSMAKDAALIVVDRGYLNHLRAWRKRVAKEAPCRVIEVDGDLVVPVHVASPKHEFAARTIRPKIHKLWDDYLKPLDMPRPKHSSLRLSIKSDFEISDVQATLTKLSFIREVKKSPIFTGGYGEATKRVDSFIRERLKNYAEARNEPADSASSKLSPYLQYGHISPVELALRVQDALGKPAVDKASYVEELIIRRELAHNHTWYEQKYETTACLPPWARHTLAKHARDPREERYTREQLEKAETDDEFWNAAQREMVVTGFMHNYMRMYWGKMILKWSRSPKAGFATNVYLNNRFLIDGLNANTYMNIGWVYGLHDRAWGPERPIFGTVRYMNAAGLERKFDMKRYIAHVDGLQKKYASA